jgi:hypothetical protein
MQSKKLGLALKFALTLERFPRFEFTAHREAEMERGKARISAPRGGVLFQKARPLNYVPRKAAIISGWLLNHYSSGCITPLVKGKK